MEKMDEKIIEGVRVRMRNAVRNAGYTINEFCEKTGVNRCILYNKKDFPTSYIVLLVSDVCNVSTDYILKGKED